LKYGFFGVGIGFWGINIGYFGSLKLEFSGAGLGFFLRGLKYKLSRSEIRSSGGVKLGFGGGGGLEIGFGGVLKKVFLGGLKFKKL